MFVFSLILLSLVAALWLALLLSPLHAWTHRNTLDAVTPVPDPTEPWPSVALVIPARNEANWLMKTVPYFCTQDYPGALRVVLVDDQSDDGSPAMLAELARRFPNLTVVRSSPRPDGWCGKPWAVQEGVRAIAGDPPDVYLFTDADCVFHPRAARQAVALALAGNYDAVSLLAQMEFGSPLESIGITGILTVINLIKPMAASNKPGSSVTLAAGGFFLIRRAAYEKVGGHEAVRREIIEDINLGQRLKDAGCTLHTRATRDLVSTRMYEGPRDLWEGLAKNAYAGMEYDPKKFWVGLVVTTLVAVLPPVYFVATLAMVLRDPSARAWTLFGLATVGVGCQAILHARTVRHVRLPAWHCVLMPASAAFYTAVTCNSAYQHHFRGGNLWAGRRYDRSMLTSAAETPAAK